MNLKEVRHYLRFYRTSLAANLAREMQYRVDFWVGLLATVGWTGLTLVFLAAVFGQVPTIAGWSWPEILMVLGFYRFLEGLGEFLFDRSFKRFSEDIRRGRLDLLLVKPLDFQFYLSFRFAHFENLSTCLVGAALFAYGFSHTGVPLDPGRLAVFFALALLGFVFFYTLWFVVHLLNFWLVKVDNLRHLTHGLVATSRYPPEAYGRKAEIFLSFIIPLALMAAFPVKTLLGRASWWYLPFSLIFTGFFFFVSRRLLRVALRSYTSAGG